MSRIGLAFGCFFKLLFGGKLPAKAVKYLPEEALPKALPEAAPTTPEKVSAVSEEVPKVKAKPKPKSNKAEHHRNGSLAMLALLQREGRLVDFLQEEIEDYDDADIGAAVRDIHRGCKKVISEYLTLEPVMPGEEEDSVTVPSGFDVGEVKLLGEVSGEPPFKGVLRHHGWRAKDVSFPKLTGEVDRHILAAAQVEVNS